MGLKRRVFGKGGLGLKSLGVERKVGLTRREGLGKRELRRREAEEEG